MRADPRARAAVLGLLLGCSGPAAACTVATTPVAFGSINPLTQRTADGVGSIRIACPEATAYTLSIAASSGDAGAAGARRLGDDGRGIDYQLYADAARRQVWGDGTGGTSTAHGTADAAGTEHTVYGRAFPRPETRAGHYSGTLLITIAY
ncbi:spore coat U domain-containing protein [Coralloluteibacterium thermophilus]|uniref:Spore coat U domain-containing protein n=1 Tax=Coralloluteibacterium thermophilum TaxID=2707049 RepID=A0ABV9NFI6_9GAMM